MPVNFETLRISEENLKKMFNQFFGHVIAMEDKLLTILKNEKRITPENFEMLFKLEQKSNKWEAKLIDEASWILSKDMPKATHLRYIIAVIRSIKDLERMSDYVINIARYFRKVKRLNVHIANVLTDILSSSILILKDVYANFLSGNNQNKEYYVTDLLPTQAKFASKYRIIFKQLGQIAFKSKNTEDALGAFTAIKNIERSVDRVVNIVENFVYISEANFSFTKETRKLNIG